MKLTCITAVFNAINAGNRDRLVRCISSVAEVSVSHEHLIFDGGSTDGTRELLEDLKNTPGVRILSEKDTGIYNALNKGVKAARGEWIYVLGCDDYVVCPEVLTELVEKVGNEKVGIVASPVYCGEAFKHACSPSRSNILFGSSYPHQGMLIRTSLAQKLNGFDERYSIAADYDQQLRAILSGARVGFQRTAFAVFGTSGISCSSEYQSRAHEDCRKILMDALRLSEPNAERLMIKRTLGIGKTISLIFYPPEIRHAALHLLARSVLRWIGLTKADGSLLWH